MARIRVQLQTGSNNIMSFPHEREGMTWLDVAMTVRHLYENSKDLFSASEQRSYLGAVNQVCAALDRARRSNFLGRSPGNQFRGTFQARYNNRPATFRVDVEVLAGQLLPC